MSSASFEKMTKAELISVIRDLYTAAELSRDDESHEVQRDLQHRHDALRDENKCMRESIDAFRKENADVREENDAFRSANANFRKENADFRQENEDFRKENTDFRQENADFRKENADFRKENAGFRHENADFRLENAGFRTENEDFRKANEDFRKVNADLREAHAGIDAIFENATQPMWAVDRRSQIVACNQAFLAFRDSVPSFPVIEHKLREFYRRAFAGDALKIEEQFPVMTGGTHGPVAERCFQFHFIPHTNNDIIERVTCTALDVTDHRRIERDLTHARDAAEEQSKQKAGFLSSMSHELRTPLNAILSYCRLIEESEPVKPEIAEYARRIEENSKRLVDIINDILQLSQAESGRHGPEMEVIDTLAAVNEVVRMLEEVARAQSITLSIGAPSVPLHIAVYRGHFTRILTNVIGNAIKFTTKGAIIINISEEGPAAARRVAISIVDSGIGISEAFLPYIFEEFRRERKDGTEGSGLGLSITKKLVEAMKGRIEIKSVEGKGTTVTIEFPKVAVLHLDGSAQKDGSSQNDSSIPALTKRALEDTRVN